MLFPESDTQHLKTWVIKRLANTSDADGDVLAEFVLALLRRDGDADSVREYFLKEIPDFLSEDADVVAFTNDVFQAVKYRSYLPGAPPPPPIGYQQPIPPTTSSQLPPRPDFQHQYPPYPVPGPVPGPGPGPSVSRKRLYHDQDDNDVDIILNSNDGYGQPAPFKRSRRGGGFPQQGGRIDPYQARGGRLYGPGMYPLPQGPGSYPPQGPGVYPAHSLYAPPHVAGLPQLDPNSIMDNIQRLHELGVPLPSNMEFPKPVFSGHTIPPPLHRREPCRDYSRKGYCSRGNKCQYEHTSESIYVPPYRLGAGGDEYDPNNAAMAMPDYGGQAGHQPVPPPGLPPFPAMRSSSRRREPRKPKRAKGKPSFAHVGPLQDRSKTAIVVQNIPPANCNEPDIRGYFSQFGKITDITMQGPDRLAIVKFQSWEEANAAWISPKVIFDNRFVKVYWYKEDGENGPAASLNGKSAGVYKNGFSRDHQDEFMEPEFDLEEFNRKQEEAQKVYQEKMAKRQEIERQKRELEERQKELQMRQLEEKRKLQAKMAANGSKDGSSSPLEIKTDGKPSSQTEALKAQLAALENEATELGLDPEAEESPFWSFRGRGRGRGYRGRGGFAPRGARGGHGHRSRGGMVEARHAAYAAYSLDLRPKTVALSGADFTNPENDEALRRHLFGIGEFKDIQGDSTTTHVMFGDRKTAEQFMSNVAKKNTIPGIEAKIEASWSSVVPKAAAAAKPSTNDRDEDFPMASGLEEEHAKEKAASGTNSNRATPAAEQADNDEVRVPEHDQRDMDYEAGDDWSIA